MGTAILVTVMMIFGEAHGGNTVEDTAAGVSAAFSGATIITLFALILTIIKVKGRRSHG
jgi:hypothetical protein